MLKGRLSSLSAQLWVHSGALGPTYSLENADLLVWLVQTLCQSAFSFSNLLRWPFTLTHRTHTHTQLSNDSQWITVESNNWLIVLQHRYKLNGLIHAHTECGSPFRESWVVYSDRGSGLDTKPAGPEESLSLSDSLFPLSVCFSLHLFNPSRILVIDIIVK